MTKKLHQKKSDRLIYKEARAAEIEIDYTVAAFDRVARQMDQKWGINRIQELVPIDMARKFGSAMGKLNEAINSQGPDEVHKRTGVCIRGLQAMDAAAEKAGHKPASTEILECKADKETWIVMKDDAAWQRVLKDNPEFARRRVVSPRVVALALEQYMEAHPMLEAVREAFPGSQVTSVRPHPIDLEEDIPF